MEERGIYRLAALDMDGTLLNSDHEMTPYTRAALVRAAQAGNVVALSTGRALSELWPFLDSCSAIHYVIGENGAVLFDVRARRVLRRVVIEPEEVDFICALAVQYDAAWQVFAGDQSYMRGPLDETLAHYHILDFIETFRLGSVAADDLSLVCRAHPGGVSKINLYFARADARREYLAKIAGRRLVISDSIALGVEQSPLGATKADGLRELCGRLGIPMEQTLAIGDGGNDLEIMQAAGLAVAMGNAIEPVRRLAGAFTEDCDHDGAAHAVERYLLGSVPANGMER